MLKPGVCPAAALVLLASACATATPLIFKALPAAGAVYGARLFPRPMNPPCAGTVRERLPGMVTGARSRMSDCAATLAHPWSEASRLGLQASYADVTGLAAAASWLDASNRPAGAASVTRLLDRRAFSSAALIQENVSVQLDRAPDGWDKPGKVALAGSAALALLPAAALFLLALILAAGFCGRYLAPPAQRSISCWW